jgi:hypothetical protein
MTGIKGQKWSKEKRRPKKIKKSIQLSELELDLIKRLAERYKISIAKTIYYLVIGKFKLCRKLYGHY